MKMSEIYNNVPIDVYAQYWKLCRIMMIAFNY